MCDKNADLAQPYLLSPGKKDIGNTFISNLIDHSKVFFPHEEID